MGKDLKRIKTQDEFVINERSMNVSVDSKDTKTVEAAIKKLGAKVTKAHDFGVVEIEVDPKLVDAIKKIDDVTKVEEIKKDKK